MTFPPPGNQHAFGNSAVIEKVYMTAIDPDPVTVMSTGTVNNLGTIIVIQGCLLPKRHKASPTRGCRGRAGGTCSSITRSFCEHLFFLAFSRHPQVSIRMSIKVGGSQDSRVTHEDSLPEYRVILRSKRLCYPYPLLFHEYFARVLSLLLICPALPKCQNWFRRFFRLGKLRDCAVPSQAEIVSDEKQRSGVIDSLAPDGYMTQLSTNPLLPQRPTEHEGGDSRQPGVVIASGESPKKLDGLDRVKGMSSSMPER